MAKDFKLDETGDLVLTDDTNDLALTEDDDVLLSQKVQSLLNTNLGELSWSEDFGANQIEIMANSDNLSALTQVIDGYLRDSLEGYDSITISSSSYNAEQRQLNLTASIKMNNGKVSNIQMGGDN